MSLHYESESQKNEILLYKYVDPEGFSPRISETDIVKTEEEYFDNGPFNSKKIQIYRFSNECVAKEIENVLNAIIPEGYVVEPAFPITFNTRARYSNEYHDWDDICDSKELVEITITPPLSNKHPSTDIRCNVYEGFIYHGSDGIDNVLAIYIVIGDNFPEAARYKDRIENILIKDLVYNEPWCISYPKPPMRMSFNDTKTTPEQFERAIERAKYVSPLDVKKAEIKNLATRAKDEVIKLGGSVKGFLSNQDM